MDKGCENGPPASRPYPRFAGVVTKAAPSSQLFKDPECWSSGLSNPRPPARQSSALSIEPTGRE